MTSASWMLSGVVPGLSYIEFSNVLRPILRYRLSFMCIKCIKNAILVVRRIGLQGIKQADAYL